MSMSSSDHKRILIADEEPTVASLLALFLTARGFHVDIIALKDLSSKTILELKADVVVVGINPQASDGFQVCRSIRQDPQTRAIPLIITTEQQPDIENLKLYYEVDDYLLKPFHPQDLIERINHVVQFKASIVTSQEDTDLEIARELGRIISGRHLEPFFQPIYLVNPMRLFGLEVLSRPQSTGLLSNPDELFAQALRHGVYHDLEMVGWSKAISVLHDYKYGGHLFLNCNPQLIEDEKFESTAALFTQQIVGNVYLEITERSSITQHEAFFKRLASAKAAGFKIAIDDVGAGYASLESIVNTRPDVVKIDRHIVSGIAQDTFKRSIIKLIVAFCHENAIVCVAEGVETRSDFDAVTSMGVDAVQGYYLYRPTSHLDIDAMNALCVK